MAKVAITEQYLTDIADAIRSKTGLTTATYLPSEMAPAIMTISGSGGIVPTGTIDITSNGTYNVTQYASAVVNVPTGSTINNQDKSITPTELQQTVTYDSGYTGLGVVTINAIPSQYIVPSGTLSITSNGVQDVTNYANVNVNIAGLDIPVFTSNDEATTISCNKTYAECYALLQNGDFRALLNTPGMQTILTGHTVEEVNETLQYYYTLNGRPWARVDYSSNNSLTIVQLDFNQQLIVTTNGTYTPDGDYMWDYVSVNVPTGSTINNQNKTVMPTESQQTITADQGYTGLGTVTVNAISSTYVGSDIAARDSDDLTTSGATVSVPAGYYSEAVSKSVASGTEGTPTASKGTVSNHSITVTPSVTNTAGYISGGTHSGTAVTVSASELVSGTYSVTASGTHNVTNYASASVAAGSTTAPASISGTAASVSTGSGTLTLTKTVSVTPTVSAGYISSGTAGNSSVSLTANVTVNPALTVSGPTVTAPAGYYTESASKSVATMTPPSEPSNNYTSGYTRLDVIDRATSTRYINIPPGYNSTGVYYQISAVYDGHATTPATTITANPTITISDSGLITATASASQSVTPTVSAGYVSSGTAGTITVSGSKTQQLTTKAAATITPTTTNQTIASGTYLTGTQTILGDANLVGSNIIAGTSIFGTNGTATFQSYYTGSSAPASSLGNNGDIYLQE